MATDTQEEGHVMTDAEMGVVRHLGLLAAPQEAGGGGDGTGPPSQPPGGANPPDT